MCIEFRVSGSRRAHAQCLQAKPKNVDDVVRAIMMVCLGGSNVEQDCSPGLMKPASVNSDATCYIHGEREPRAMVTATLRTVLGDGYVGEAVATSICAIPCGEGLELLLQRYSICQNHQASLVQFLHYRVHPGAARSELSMFRHGHARCSVAQLLYIYLAS